MAETRGEYERVVALAEDVLAVLPVDWVYEKFGMIAPASVYGRSWLVMSLAELGRFGEAIDHGREAMRIPQGAKHAYTIGLAHRAVGTMHLLKGEWREACQTLEDGIAVLQAAEVALSLAPTLASCAWALAQLAETGRAEARLGEGEEAMKRLAERGRTQLRGWDYHALGRACLLLGHYEQAKLCADRAIELLEAQPGAGAHALNLLGDVESCSDDLDCAEDHYRRALIIAEERGMRPLLAHSHYGLGKVYRRTNDRKKAHEHLTIARTTFQEAGMTFWTRKASAEAVRLLD